MAEKHSKIYTRRGDDGSTGLANGQRVQKDSARMEAIGAVDELNSLIGILAAMDIPQQVHTMLLEIQHHLFDIGGSLAMPNRSLLEEDAVTGLEGEIDRLDAGLPTLNRFILPGGTLQAAHCHSARSVCRRAERRVLAMQQAEGDDSDLISIRYLNRLSDLLFVLARTLSRLNDGEEIFWHN
jgi:cob(I)alamin adenosyltransferase